jgi:hypothetical protein
MYTGLQVKYPLFLSDFNETSIFSTDFRKLLRIKFYKNPFIWSRVVVCGVTDRHGEANRRFSQLWERTQNGALGQPIG